MKITNVNRRIRCDMPNCRNVADSKIEKDGFFRAVGICLYKDCMKQMYECLASIIVPKSPDNMLNKRIKVSKERSGEK